MGISYSSPISPYDWKPELPDFRDSIFRYPRSNTKNCDSIDLRHKFKSYSSNFGSSSASSVAAVLDSLDLKYSFDNSNTNDLTTIRNSIKKFKIIDENNKEYEAEEEEKVTKDNEKHLKYTKLCNFKNQLKQSLSEGYPIIFGFTVYESFNEQITKTDGIITNPDNNEKILGGLSAIIVGFDNIKGHWIVRHTLGNHIGDNGYIYIPFSMLEKANNLSTDYWRITYE